MFIWIFPVFWCELILEVCPFTLYILSRRTNTERPHPSKDDAFQHISQGCVTENFELGLLDWFIKFLRKNLEWRKWVEQNLIDPLSISRDPDFPAEYKHVHIIIIIIISPERETVFSVTLTMSRSSSPTRWQPERNTCCLLLSTK